MDRTRPSAVSVRPEGAADAPARLIGAAIELFGRKGFEATSTREIARAAGVNIAGIAYHFGGKQGLYEACASHIAGFVRSRIEQRLGTIDPARPDFRTPDQAVAALREMLSAMIGLLLATPQMASFARFVLREQMDPSPAFDILFEATMEPLHMHICRLWSAATGEPADAEETIARMLGLLGQVFMFRLARAGALRRLGWTDMGERETMVVERMVHGSLDALLAAARRRP
jgi:AcrR family transcriptional regulator